MFAENQEIIYKKNGSEISRLTSDNLKDLPDPLIAYIRYYQPFTEKGILTIPEKGNKGIIRTSSIEEGGVKRENNTLIIKTLNSIYEIEYKNIDLEKILADGMPKGVNKFKGNEIAPFP